MGKSVKRKGNSGGRRSSRYRPDRKAKLEAFPPPLPTNMPEAEGFGTADEDGLRMIGALETMDGLEPDFGDEFAEAGEASVMIVERTGPVEGDETADSETLKFFSLQDRLSATFAEIEVEAIAAAFCEPLGEAAVDIFEAPEAEHQDYRTGAARLPEGSGSAGNR